MSLKAFHYVFLVASVSVTLLFGIHAVREILHSGATLWPVISALGAAAGLAALTRYALWVRVKLLQESYL